MADQQVKFGLTLPNRGVVFGATTVPEMLALAERARDGGSPAGTHLTVPSLV